MGKRTGEIKFVNSCGLKKLIDKWLFAPAHEMNIWQSNLQTTPYQHLFYYDKRKGVYVTSKGGRRFFFVIAFLCLSIICVGINLVRAYKRATGDQKASQQVYIDLGWLSMDVAGIVMKLEYLRKAKYMALLFNQSHQLERRTIAEEKGIDMVFRFKGEAAIWSVISMMCLNTYYSLAASVFVLVLVKPCLPILTTSMVLPCDEHGVLQVPHEMSFRLSIYATVVSLGLLDGLVMFNLIAGPCMANIPGNYYFQVTLRRYVQHAIETKTRVFKFINVLLWRRYHVMLMLLNEVNASVIIPALCTSWEFVLVLGMFIGIRLFGVIPLPIYIMFLIATVDGIFCVNFIYKAAGEINELSLELIGKWKYTSLRGKEPKLNRKYVRSCRPLKVKIGSSNFFEMTTPLVAMDFCLDQLVTLLIAA